MPGTLRIAFKLLVNDRAKYGALLVGITFAVFLMIEMTSLFSGVLARSSATVRNIGASIWVMDPAVQTVAPSRCPITCSTRSAAFPASPSPCRSIPEALC
jgi:putative ABC transport system permease protein